MVARGDGEEEGKECWKELTRLIEVREGQT